MKKMKTALLLLLNRLGPLAPIAAFVLLFFVVFLLMRLGLSLYYLPVLIETQGSWRLFFAGVRIDTIVLSFFLLLPALLVLILPAFLRRFWQPVVMLYLALCSMVFLFLEAATPFFLEQYGVRPNRFFIEYLDSPKEVFVMLFAHYKLALVLGVFIVAAGLYLGWQAGRIGFAHYKNWGFWRRLIALPLVVLLLGLGARSSLGTSAANLGATIVSDSQLINELTANATFTLAHALYAKSKEQDLTKRYGSLPKEEILKWVRLEKTAPVATQNSNPPNLVIILWESMGAEHTGVLGGLPLTPNFDRLSKEGLLLTNLYATGTRTNRGIEAVLAGWPPLVHESVLKLGFAQENFFTTANYLAGANYRCHFFYGGDANFDNMRRFLAGNGFKIHEFKDIKEPVFVGKWGASDGDLFRYANKVLAAEESPFCGAIMTLSGHLPFDYPVGGFAPYNQPDFTAENAALYADWALGRFFEEAKNLDYYDNTFFLIVADHTLKVRGSGVFPPQSKYHIPALILGPNIQPGTINTLSSQIDLLPTLLALMNASLPHPLIGQNLLDQENPPKNRALFENSGRFAYRLENQMVVFAPNADPVQVVIAPDGTYLPQPVDSALVREGLAHLLLPQMLYGKRLHKPHTK